MTNSRVPQTMPTCVHANPTRNAAGHAQDLSRSPSIRAACLQLSLLAATAATVIVMPSMETIEVW